MRSLQVRFAHDDVDRAEARAAVARLADLLCIPAVSAHVQLPAPLGVVDADRVLVFRRDDAPTILRHVRPAAGGEAPWVATQAETEPLYFEWSHTARDGDGPYIASGASGGRLYYSNVEQGHGIREVFLRARRMIVAGSPWVSSGRYPVHLGRSLGTRMWAGECAVIHPNGAPVQFVPRARSGGG